MIKKCDYQSTTVHSPMRMVDNNVETIWTCSLSILSSPISANLSGSESEMMILYSVLFRMMKSCSSRAGGLCMVDIVGYCASLNAKLLVWEERL